MKTLNVLAQALWKVRETRSPEDLDRFVARLRVYAISDHFLLSTTRDGASP